MGNDLEMGFNHHHHPHQDQMLLDGMHGGGQMMTGWTVEHHHHRDETVDREGGKGFIEDIYEQLYDNYRMVMKFMLYNNMLIIQEITVDMETTRETTRLIYWMLDVHPYMSMVRLNLRLNHFGPDCVIRTGFLSGVPACGVYEEYVCACVDRVWDTFIEMGKPVYVESRDGPILFVPDADPPTEPKPFGSADSSAGSPLDQRSSEEEDPEEEAEGQLPILDGRTSHNLSPATVSSAVAPVVYTKSSKKE